MPWLIRSLVREAHAAPPSFILVEYSHELQRADALKQLRKVLAPDHIPVHEILLSSELKGGDDAPVRHLLEMLDHEPAGGVVFVSQFERILPKASADRAKVLALFNWYRESLAERPLHQVWWVTTRVAATIARAIPDLDSWFLLRLNLHREDEHLRSELDLTGWRDSDTTKRSLIEKAEQLLAEADRLDDAGRYPEAISLAREALRLREHLLGIDDRATLNALSLVAILLSEMGDLASAEPLYRRALETRERVLGPEHPDTLKSLNNLANLLSAQGNLAAAEPLYRRALETSERVLGPEHPDTLKSLNNLANLLYEQGNLAAAEPLYRRGLETSERVLGPEHPDTLMSLSNLAVLLSKQGNLAAAEPLYRRALETSERVLGPEHPDTLGSLNNVANLLSDQGNLAAAEPLYRRALETSERVLGPEHPATVKIRNNYDNLNVDLGAKSKSA
jgi:tetratricopeptide (TPR) repeat protein